MSSKVSNCRPHVDNDDPQTWLQGDSGGPLVMKDNAGGRTVLTGAVSMGWKCGVKDYPGIYTEVSYFLDWIQNHTQALTKAW